MNISTTFIELALATAKLLGQEGDRVMRKARGSYAPYRIRNRTGCPVYIWSDVDGSVSATDAAMTEIAHDKEVDWRFDDWRTMREVSRVITFRIHTIDAEESTSLRLVIIA